MSEPFNPIFPGSSPMSGAPGVPSAWRWWDDDQGRYRFDESPEATYKPTEPLYTLSAAESLIRERVAKELEAEAARQRAFWGEGMTKRTGSAAAWPYSRAAAFVRKGGNADAPPTPAEPSA